MSIAVCNNSGNHTNLIKNIVGNIRTLSDRGIAVEFCWIPGHAGIAANDLADAAAKSAAVEAQAWTIEQDESETTMESAKKQLKLELVRIWQRQWDVQSEGRYTHNILPVVKLNRLKNIQHGNVLRQADARFNRLLSGNTLLKAHHLSQALNRRAGSDASTQCECGRAPQDAEHYLLECPLFNSERQIMLDTITEAVLSTNRNINIPLDTNLLLGDAETIPKDIKVKVRRAAGPWQF